LKKKKKKQDRERKETNWRGSEVMLGSEMWLLEQRDHGKKFGEREPIVR
jgi:hypothetical protein